MSMTVTEQVPASARKARVLDYVGLAVRLVLGLTLISAGASKITALQASVRAVLGYEIFPYDVAHLIGTVLPMLEIAFGLLLVLGLFVRVSAIVGGLFMVAFIAGIASVWIRGITIDCGCFGGGGTIDASQTHYLQEIMRDVGLALCATWLAARPRSAVSLDHRLFG